MNTILELDKDLLVWINSFHVDWLDPIMLTITKTEFWTPVYLLFIYLIFQKADSMTAWWMVAGAGLTVLLADQITASIMKPFFERWRPSRDPNVNYLLHLVMQPNGEPYTGGKYGFASSHAANSFGIATYMWLQLRSKYKWLVLFFIWAAFLTYTRLYLGVHYPGDILVGGLVGVLSAFAGIKFFKWIEAKRLKQSETSA